MSNAADVRYRVWLDAWALVVAATDDEVRISKCIFRVIWRFPHMSDDVEAIELCKEYTKKHSSWKNKALMPSSKAARMPSTARCKIARRAHCQAL